MYNVLYNMPIKIRFFSWEQINHFHFISYGINSCGIRSVWYKSKDLERIKDVYRGTTVCCSLECIPGCVGPLQSQRFGAPLRCGWSKGPPLTVIRNVHVLNIQLRRTDSWCPSSLVLGVGLATPHRKKRTAYNEKLQKASDLDGIFGTS
jgi:hypothetical protein